MSIRIGSAAATPFRTVKPISPQLMRTGFSSFPSNIFCANVPRSSSASWTLRVQKVPAGMMNAIRPRAVLSESWIVSPRPARSIRPLIVPLVPASATP